MRRTIFCLLAVTLLMFLWLTLVMAAEGLLGSFAESFRDGSFLSRPEMRTATALAL